MSQDTYKKETETVPFQGKNITLVNYTPILSPEQREKLNLEIEQSAALTAETVSPEQIETISNYLADWGNVSFDDKRRVVDLMISAIHATSESINIVWKI